jgi:hypothetical protein
LEAAFVLEEEATPQRDIAVSKPQTPEFGSKDCSAIANKGGFAEDISTWLKHQLSYRTRPRTVTLLAQTMQQEGMTNSVVRCQRKCERREKVVLERYAVGRWERPLSSDDIKHGMMDMYGAY